MSAPASGPEPRQVELTLRLLSHPKRAGPSDHTVSVSSESTISHVKQLIAKWDGQPAESGIIVVKGGRICQEAEKVGELIPEQVSWHAASLTLDRSSTRVGL